MNTFNKLCTLLILAAGCQTAKAQTWSKTPAPDTMGWTYVSTGPNSTVFAKSAKGDYRSNDNGATWTKAALSRDKVVSTITGTLLGIDAINLNRSTDGGDTWTNITSGASNNYVIQLPGRILFATDYQIKCSTDDAQTFVSNWHKGSGNPPAVKSYTYNFAKNILYVGTYNKGIAMSTDTGHTFTTAPGSSNFGQIFGMGITIDGTIFAVGTYHVYRSSNDGASWDDLDIGAGSVQNTSIWVSTAGVVYVSTGAGVYVSQDKGATWTNMSDGLGSSGGGISNLAESSEGDIFAVQSNWGGSNGVFKMKGLSSSTQVAAKSINTLKVYPNPAQESLQVELPANVTQATVRLNNWMGQEVKIQVLTGQNNRIDLSNVAPGLYQVSLQSGNELYTQKLMVNR